MAEQCRVAQVALLLRPPVQGAGVGTVGLQQFQAESGAGGGVADHGAGAGVAGQVLDDSVQQRVVAAGEHEAVGEQTAVAGFEHPAVDEFAREDPFAGDLGAGDAAFGDQGIDLFLIEVQIFSRLLDVEETRQVVDDRSHDQASVLV